MKHSADYHDYVFKNGKRVHKFDEMYRYSRDVPWHQDTTAFAVFSEIDLAILKQYRYRTICDVGSGLGYFADRLHSELVNDEGMPPAVTGIDISPTAVRKARRLFPGVRFVAADLTRTQPLPKERFDLVVVKEVLWYVCHRLAAFLGHAGAMVNDGGFLYISQSFPESAPWVGQDVIGSPERLLEICSRYAECVHHVVERDSNYSGRPLVHFLGIVRAQ